MEKLFAAVKRVLDHSNDMDCVGTKLKTNWQEGKSKFIEEFGGGLIVESPHIFSVDKPSDDKILEYRQYVDDISYNTANEELRAFLIDQGWTAFYENATREKWEKHGFKIPKGMKITRALRFFIKNKIELDKWQTVYSRLIQNLKISGRLCISVHPLDYLSSSETTHNWRTCHSLDGEFRAGNLSYMQDKCTVVAYLKSDGEYELPNFPADVPWNSKKWRMLFYVNGDRDLIFSSRPYPFDNEILVKASYALLQGIFKDTEWPENYQEMSFEEAMHCIDENPDGVQFNDCLVSSSYQPRYKVALHTDIDQCEPVVVGAPTWCLECENEIIEFGADYTCMDCGDYVICEMCDSHLYEDEACYLDKQYICPDCYDDAVVWCDGCGEARNRNNPEIIYEEEDDVWYCPKCYDEFLDQQALRLQEEIE